MYLQEAIPSGQTKAALLRVVLKNVVSRIDPATTTNANLEQMLQQEFNALPSGIMLPFEMEEERARMEHVLERWLDFERTVPNKILSRNYTSTMQFAGDQITVSGQLLVDRGKMFESIRVKYKEPEYSMRGRLATTRPDHSAELLKLQRAGEAEATRLGFDITKKPVYGAIFYLKSKNDTSVSYADAFEGTTGSNIIRWCFTPADAATVEKEAVKPDPTKTCDPKGCYDCRYADLCHLTFEKRQMMEQPPIETKTIDNIVFTDAQYAFISFDSGECRANAFAGSGKTVSIGFRVCSLISNGTDPSHILMLTFTDKAREEMRLKLVSITNGDLFKYSRIDISGIEIETFNSWGQKMLEKYYKTVGYSAPPSMIDDITKKDIIIDLLTKYRCLPLDYRNPFMSTKAADGAVVKLGKWLDALKAAHAETVNDVVKALGDSLKSFAPTILQVYQEYNQKLVAINAIDYEDQLRLLLKLSDSGVFETLPYEHVIVDEFQDSNPNQIAIILELKKRNKGIKSLAVVGDELQAIYGFRNATPDNLVDFANYFPGMVDIDMTANFRSQEPIIRLANQIIAKTSRLGKAIEAHRNTSNVQPAVLCYEDKDKEAELYAKQIRKLIKDGTKPSSIAVLCRTRSELLRMQAKFNEYGIPTLLKVPEIIGDAPYVKAIIGLASFLVDNEDMASLALYAKSMGQDIYDQKALEETKNTLVGMFAGFTNEADKITGFYELCKDAEEDYVAKAFMAKVRALEPKSLTQILNYCVKYKTYKVRDTQSTILQDTDCVTLITVHSSKGLEWDVVLCSLRSFNITDEEKRLFYVAVTRAREKLLVTYTEKQAVLADLVRP